MSKCGITTPPRVRLIYLLPLAGSVLSFTPVADPADCKQDLLTAYHRLAGLATPARGIYHLQFTSTAVYAVPEQQTERKTTVKGELYSQGNRGFFKTVDISVWQDGHYVATALHPQRTILLTRAAPGQAAMNPQQLFLMRDSLIRLGAVEMCRNEEVNKQPQQHLRLAYSGALAVRLKISQLDFWLTPQHTLQKMIVQYRPGSTMRQVTFCFPVQEWMTASAKLPVDARSCVVNTQGQLLPEYKDYRLVNQLTPRR